MTQEDAKELWPIVKAYSEGKTIEYLTTGDEWVELKDPGFNYNANMYRIKPDPKYRPFKDEKECFEEMKKHEPFGWIKNKTNDNKVLILGIIDSNIVFYIYNKEYHSYHYVYENYIFLDDAPFGIKEG